MENEVKNEGQESLDDTIITTAPVVDDVVEEAAPPVEEAMPAIEPIPAEPVAAPAPVEPVVEEIPAIPAVEPAPVEEVAAPAPVEEVEVKVEEVKEEVKPVEEAKPVEEPKPVEEVKDEVKGVEVNPNTVSEAVPGVSTQTAVDAAPPVDLNGGNFKEEAEPKSKANSLPKIIAAVIILALIIAVGFNIDKISSLFVNLNGNGSGNQQTEPTPTPEVVQEETKLTCQKSNTAADGTITQETYTYSGINNSLKNYTYVVNVSNPTNPIVAVQAANAACQSDKLRYLSEAGYSLTCETTDTNAVKTLVIDTATYDLYSSAQANEEAQVPVEGDAPVDEKVVAPAPEFGLNANMEDIKAQKVGLGFTCE